MKHYTNRHLLNYMKKHDIDVKQLAKATKLSESTIDNAIKGYKLSVDTACRIQLALGLSAKELLVSQIRIDVKKRLSEIKDVDSIKCNKHVKGQLDIRTYNALRRHECKKNFLFDVKSLLKLQTDDVLNIGEKSLEYIRECPEKYVIEDTKLFYNYRKLACPS